MWGFQAYLPTIYLKTVKEGFKNIARTWNLHNLNQYLLRILHKLNNPLVVIFLWCPIITWFFFPIVYTIHQQKFFIQFFLIRSVFLIGLHNATTCTIEGFFTNKENKCYWYYLYNEDCAQSNSFMTLVSHEKLSDC